MHSKKKKFYCFLEQMTFSDSHEVCSYHPWQALCVAEASLAWQSVVVFKGRLQWLCHCPVPVLREGRLEVTLPSPASSLFSGLW